MWRQDAGARFAFGLGLLVEGIGARALWPSVFGPEDEVGEPASSGLGPHFVEGRADG